MIKNPPSPLDRVATFFLDAPLSDENAEALRAVPGVGVWHVRPGLTVPINAAQLVVDWLEARGLKAGVRMPPSFTPPGGLKTSEVHPWVYSGGGPLLPRPFQIKAAVNRRKAGGGHIWSDPGSGKTLTAVLFGFSYPGPIVIVTGAKAVLQWRDEGVEYFTSARSYVFRPPSRMRKRDRTLEEYIAERMAREARPVVIIGWDNLAEHAHRLHVLAQDPRGLTVIFDEGHRGKQDKRSRWIPEVDAETGEDKLREEALPSMSRAAYDLACVARYRLETTGSAVYNRVGTDLWGLLTLVEPGSWGKTARRFKVRYADGREGDFGGMVAKGLTNVDELKARLLYTVERIPYATTHAELPALRNRTVWVPVDQQDAPLSWSKHERAALAQAEAEWARGSAAAKGRVAEYRRMDAASRKRTAVADMVREYLQGEGKRKVIVFTGRTADCDALGAKLRRTAEAVGGGFWVAHGEDSTQVEREAIRREYMAHPGPALLIGTGQSWGESLNLHDTDAIVFAMIPITPGEMTQWRGRVQRLGMTRPCVCVFMCAEGTIDERCVSIITSKLPQVEALTGPGSLDGVIDALRGWDDEGAMYDAILSAIRPAGDADTDDANGTWEQDSAS